MKKITLLLTMLLTAYSINAKTTHSTDTEIQGYCELYINNTPICFSIIHDVFLNKRQTIYHNLNIKPPGRFNAFALWMNYADDIFGAAMIPSANIVRLVNAPIIIGTSWVNIPENYSLYVEDGILTERLKVTQVDSTDWTDYVFKDDYDLKSTEEVEEFIKGNKHLPNVPSAQEVSKNGVDIVEMDATLLRQIEELWLHVIELKKENDTLKKDIETLKSNK